MIFLKRDVQQKVLNVVGNCSKTGKALGCFVGLKEKSADLQTFVENL